MGLCQNILDIAVDAAKKNKAGKILKITIRAGEMRGLVEDQMQFCFQFVSKDTIAEGATLKVEKIEIAAKCKDCNREFTVKEYLFVCPGCSGTNLDISTGQELLIKDIEVA
jgi:hydrogenase nickel incorporation protein HypA/HybF